MLLLVVVLLLTGISLMMIALIRDQHQCPKEKIVYRYLPRSFNEDQSHQVPVSQIFSKMFSNPSPWVSGLNTYDTRKQTEMRQYFEQV